VCKGWAERTPEGFDFSVKLYQKFTHPRMYQGRIERSLGQAGTDDPLTRDVVDTLVKPTGADYDEFKRGIEPLAAKGKLGAVLAQFPPSFKHTPATRDYLTDLLRALGDYDVAVELRHKSWSDTLGDTLALLNGFRAAFVQIDEPKFALSIRQNYLPNVDGFYYMRLHGRNAARWWSHEHTEDRYDYLYSAGELKEFSETAESARRLVKKLYLYTNNHFSAKSVANAAMIKQQIGQTLRGDYPQEFLSRYPEIISSSRSPEPSPTSS
jgi:uncharacterized protein YecE (DUF72 family)